MNTILKHGDLVKYHVKDMTLDDMGFKLGQVYMVMRDGLGLYVRPSVDAKGIGLVDLKENLTDHADNFTKHSCPAITLPVGKVSL